MLQLDYDRCKQFLWNKCLSTNSDLNDRHMLGRCQHQPHMRLVAIRHKQVSRCKQSLTTRASIDNRSDEAQRLARVASKHFQDEL